jgi:hypothetical protein
MLKWRPMDRDGCHGVPLLKKVIELAPHVVVLDVRVKQKNRHVIHVESRGAKAGVRVYGFARVFCN